MELDPGAPPDVGRSRQITYDYGKLLLATGGRPRRLDVEGADSEGVHYYRSLEDYLFFDELPRRASSTRWCWASGFIGMEMAAALVTPARR